MKMPATFRLCFRALLGAVVFGLCLGLVATSRAAPTAAPVAEADEDRFLQSGFTRAREQLGRNNPAEALVILEETYAKVPTPALLWPIAELQLRLVHPKEARAALDKYVAQVPPGKMPKGQQLPDVERLRGELHKLFGRLELADVQPGTELSIDGEALPAAALSTLSPVDVNPGSHRLEWRRGGRTFSREVAVQSGQTVRVELRDAAQPSDGGLAVGREAGPRRPVRTAAVVLGGIGIAGIVAGGVLWGLDGRQSCPQAPMCRFALDSKATGVGLLSAGLGLGGAALILGILDARSQRAARVAWASRPN